MQDPSDFTVVLITPGIAGITVCEHYQAMRGDIVFFEILIEAFKAGTAATVYLVVSDTVQVIRIVILRIVYRTIKR